MGGNLVQDGGWRSRAGDLLLSTLRRVLVGRGERVSSGRDAQVLRREREGRARLQWRSGRLAGLPVGECLHPSGRENCQAVLEGRTVQRFMGFIF